MHCQARFQSRIANSLTVFLLSTLLVAGLSSPTLAQTKAATTSVAPATTSDPPQPAPTERDLAATQDQLIKLLRLSPTLTTVVEHDPTLLANQEYVNRNNPQLGQFLLTHPEVGRNPEFYLFTRLQADGSPDQALDRAVWPQFSQPHHERSTIEGLADEAIPFLVFLCAMGALIWLSGLFLENRRWNRIFKLQSEVHGKLIEKFSSNEDLLVYMGTDAGKRFLEAAPIPVNFEPDQRVPNAVARVLTPLQIGIVLSLLGAGLLMLRNTQPDMRLPMLLLGTVVLMPGLGFIISSAITWILAGRLGLMPAPNSPSDPRPYSSFRTKDSE